MRLHVLADTTDEDIQNALYNLFHSSPQCNQGPQGRTIWTTSPQGEFRSTNELSQPSIIAATAISKI